MLRLLTAVCVGVLVSAAQVPQATPESAWVRRGAEGRLIYKTTERGDRIPDFSNAGYREGLGEIPEVAVRERLSPEREGDDTARIQAAIDRVAGSLADSDGRRGAVLLAEGEYRIGGSLRISASGVVLRGSGEKTVLRATGATTRALVVIDSPPPPPPPPTTRRGRTSEIIDPYVPVGARAFTVAPGHGLRVRDTVYVVRAGNAAWISEIGMDRIPPRANPEERVTQWTPFELRFDRVVTAVDGDRIEVDAPIVCAIDTKWGGGRVEPFEDRRISEIGVERLSAISDFDPSIVHRVDGVDHPSDENHADYLVRIESARNVWVRNVRTTFFQHGVVNVGRGAKWVTIADSRAEKPVSRIQGGRRYPFHLAGQLTLVRDCTSDGARHAFVFNSRVPGPNVFRRCTSEREFNSSEPHHRWSVGGLYDSTSGALAIQDRLNMGSGHGWSGANFVAWNHRGSLILQSPPTAQNWAIGFVGERRRPAFPEGRSEGEWDSIGTHVTPASLYEAQLMERYGRR